MSGSSAEETILQLTSWAFSNGASLHPLIEIYHSPVTSLSFRVKPSSSSSHSTSSPATATAAASSTPSAPALAPASVSEEIAPWTPIVRIPTRRLALSYLNAIDARSSAFISPHITEALAPHVTSRLVLIREFLRGRDSFWYPYIHALPQPAGPAGLVAGGGGGGGGDAEWLLPPFWQDEEREIFEGTNLQVGIEKIRKDVRKELREIESVLERTEVDPVLKEGFSRNLYYWAYCIFSSRSFRPSLVLPLAQDVQHAQDEKDQGGERGGEKGGGKGGAKEAGRRRSDDFSVLLPLFDIGNHDMTVDIAWHTTFSVPTNSSSSAGGGTGAGTGAGAGAGAGAKGTDVEQPFCELRVGKAYAAGQQVFNNYGMKTNAELVLGYGFLIPATQELHNDYIHVRKRASLEPNLGNGDKGGEGGGGGDEYLLSLRPLQDKSSLLGRKRLGTQDRELIQTSQIMPALQHVPPSMIWDIFSILAPTPQRRQELIPVHLATAVQGSEADQDHKTDQEGNGEESRDEQKLDHLRGKRLLRGDVKGEEAEMHLEQTVAIVQNKVLQELERLDETEVEVVGADVAPTVQLAMEYRGRCRAVLEAVLESMGVELQDAVETR